VNLQTLGTILGEELARKLGDLSSIHHGTHEPSGAIVIAVGALQRRREAQSKRGDRALRRHRVRRPGQVMHLVEHHEPEAIAVALHVRPGRVVRRDGDRMDLVDAPAQQPHRIAERATELVVPLADQIERGGDDQRAAIGVRDAQLREERLPRPGRQHHYAPTSTRPPGVEGRPLVFAGLAIGHVAALERRVRPGLVAVRRLSPMQVEDHVVVPDRRPAGQPHPRIVNEPLGQLPVRDALEQQRPAIEPYDYQIRAPRLV
jgi:hypothetical protein